jgi:hypothetical protein
VSPIWQTVKQFDASTMQHFSENKKCLATVLRRFHLQISIILHTTEFVMQNEGYKLKKVKGRKAGFIQHCSSLKPIVLSPLMM